MIEKNWHREKVQFQGPSIKENVRKGSSEGSHTVQIFSDKPIAGKVAKALLNEKFSSLSEKERAAMEPFVKKANKWIDKCMASGSVSSTYCSFQNRKNGNGDRVDIRVDGKINLIS